MTKSNAGGIPLRRTTLIVLSAIYCLTLGVALPLPHWQTMLSIAIVPFLVWLTANDLVDRTIPDAASTFVAILGFLVTVGGEHGSAWPTIVLSISLLITLAWLGSLYWRREGEEALGLGDVKLIAAGTLLVGAQSVWIMLVLASVGGIAGALLSRKSGNRGVPFGPFLAYSIFITFTIFGGPQ